MPELVLFFFILLGSVFIGLGFYSKRLILKICGLALVVISFSFFKSDVEESASKEVENKQYYLIYQTLIALEGSQAGDLYIENLENYFSDKVVTKKEFAELFISDLNGQREGKDISSDSTDWKSEVLIKVKVDILTPLKRG